jgi:hypothetical protein
MNRHGGGGGEGAVRASQNPPRLYGWRVGPDYPLVRTTDGKLRGIGNTEKITTLC